MALEKKYRQQARAEALQAAAKGGVAGAGLGLKFGAVIGGGGGSWFTAPVGGAIGAGLGAVGAGLTVRLQAGREYRDLQKLQKQQQKLLSEQTSDAEAENRRARGRQAEDNAYLGVAEPDEWSLGIAEPGISSYDAYKRRRYG